MKKLTMSQLQILMANALDVAWKNLCEIDTMISSFVYVGLSSNVDSSEHHRMKFQGQQPEEPPGFEYWNLKQRHICINIFDEFYDTWVKVAAVPIKCRYI